MSKGLAEGYESIQQNYTSSQWVNLRAVHENRPDPSTSSIILKVTAVLNTFVIVSFLLPLCHYMSLPCWFPDNLGANNRLWQTFLWSVSTHMWRRAKDHRYITPPTFRLEPKIWGLPTLTSHPDNLNTGGVAQASVGSTTPHCSLSCFCSRFIIRLGQPNSDPVGIMFQMCSKVIQSMKEHVRHTNGRSPSNMFLHGSYTFIAWLPRYFLISWISLW